MRGERVVVIVSAGILVVAVGTAFMIMGLTRDIDWLLDVGIALVLLGLIGGLSPLVHLRSDSSERVFAETTPTEIAEIISAHSTIQAQKLLAPYRGQWLRIEGKIQDISEYDHGFSMVTIDSRRGEPEIIFFFTDRKVVERRLFGLKRGTHAVIVGQIDWMKFNDIALTNCELESVGMGKQQEVTSQEHKD